MMLIDKKKNLNEIYYLYVVFNKDIPVQYVYTAYGMCWRMCFYL